jgi:hypothetical protein
MIVTKVVLINLAKDKQRLEDSRRELGKYGIDFKRIPGMLMTDRSKGFSSAYVNALKAIRGGGIIFEDDIELDNFFIPDLPEGWDMLYFGANLQEETEPVNSQLVRVLGAWTTHAILYSAEAVEKILSQYDYEKDGIYDDWLRRVFCRNNSCYMVTPMIAFQRDGYSNLIKQDASYREGFIDNYKKYTGR